RSQRGRSPSGASGGGGGCCSLPPSAHPCKPFASGRSSHSLQTPTHSFHLQRRHVRGCRIRAIFSQDALPLLNLLICRTHQNLVTVSLRAHYYIPFRRLDWGECPSGEVKEGFTSPSDFSRLQVPRSHCNGTLVTDLQRNILWTRTQTPRGCVFLWGLRLRGPARQPSSGLSTFMLFRWFGCLTQASPVVSRTPRMYHAPGNSSASVYY